MVKKKGTIRIPVKAHSRKMKKTKPKARKFGGKKYNYTGQLPRHTAVGMVKYKKEKGDNSSYRIIPTPKSQDTGGLNDRRHYSVYKRKHR